MFKKSLIKRIFLFVLLATVSLFVVNNYSQAQTSNNLEENCVYHEEVYQDLALDKLASELKHNGLIGSIHGAAVDYNLFVLSVRNPDNFFDHREFSLVTKNQEVFDLLAQVKRHDRVCIQGYFMRNPSPQKHILVEDLIIQEAYDDGVEIEPYQRDQSLPDQLAQTDSLIGKVHVVGGEGKILVMEYQDLVIPVFVKKPELTANLYRGDILKLHYKIQDRPEQPTHLRLNLDEENPLEIIDSLATWHQEAKTLRGTLVKFPKSPQVNFDVFAIAVETAGVNRYFTLVNFEDPTEFMNIRTKLSEIWDQHLETVVAGRNVLINPDVMLEVEGIINVESPVQANPQVLLENSEKINQVIGY
jgi:hypothetical protein